MTPAERKAYRQRQKDLRMLAQTRDRMRSKIEAAARRREAGDEQGALRLLFEAQNLKRDVEAMERELKPQYLGREVKGP